VLLPLPNTRETHRLRVALERIHRHQHRRTELATQMARLRCRTVDRLKDAKRASKSDNSLREIVDLYVIRLQQAACRVIHSRTSHLVINLCLQQI